jgi:hypothetical protein
MMWLVLGLALSGLGAVPVMGTVVYLIRERRGDLAGYWYQITYGPGDDVMKGPVWSIELLRLHHYRDAARGSMWRIYPHHFERCWDWKATCEGSLVMGWYKAVSGDGRSGLLLMSSLDRKHLIGHHFAASAAGGPGPPVVSVTLEQAPMEWVALESCRGAALADWITTLPDRGCTRFLSWGAKRCLFGWREARGAIVHSLGYGASATNPLPALEIARAAREDRARRAANPLPPPSAFHRQHIVGVEPLHPKDTEGDANQG